MHGAVCCLKLQQKWAIRSRSNRTVSLQLWAPVAQVKHNPSDWLFAGRCTSFPVCCFHWDSLMTRQSSQDLRVSGTQRSFLLMVPAEKHRYLYITLRELVLLLIFYLTTKPSETQFCSKFRYGFGMITKKRCWCLKNWTDIMLSWWWHWRNITKFSRGTLIQDRRSKHFHRRQNWQCVSERTSGVPKTNMYKKVHTEMRGELV